MSSSRPARYSALFLLLALGTCAEARSAGRGRRRRARTGAAQTVSAYGEVEAAGKGEQQGAQEQRDARGAATAQPRPSLLLTDHKAFAAARTAAGKPNNDPFSRLPWPDPPTPGGTKRTLDPFLDPPPLQLSTEEDQLIQFNGAQIEWFLQPRFVVSRETCLRHLNAQTTGTYPVGVFKAPLSPMRWQNLDTTVFMHKVKLGRENIRQIAPQLCSVPTSTPHNFRGTGPGSGVNGLLFERDFTRVHTQNNVTARSDWESGVFKHQDKLRQSDIMYLAADLREDAESNMVVGYRWEKSCFLESLVLGVPGVVSMPMSRKLENCDLAWREFLKNFLESRGKRTRTQSEKRSKPPKLTFVGREPSIGAKLAAGVQEAA